MAKDLILGRTKRNWARGRKVCAPSEAPPLPVTDEVTFRLNPQEMDLLAAVAAAKIRADAGDRRAQAQVRELGKKVAKLKVRAGKGDASAKRTLLVLRESGVFRGVETMSLGEDASPAGTVSNLNYRVAVVRQALASAKKNGRPRPTTRDFYQAKTAVDGTMARAGLSLYLPRSRPARQTL
jgi:hypothetical protein